MQEDPSADVNCKGMWDNTPLICACQYKHAAVALALIEAGADVNAVNEKGNTALLHCAVEGLHEVMKVLLEKGATVNMPASLIYNGEADANQSLTPLEAAKRNNREECVALLIQHGATSTIAPDAPKPSEVASAVAQHQQPAANGAPAPAGSNSGEPVSDPVALLVQSASDTPAAPKSQGTPDAAATAAVV